MASVLYTYMHRVIKLLNQGPKQNFSSKQKKEKYVMMKRIIH